MRVVYVIDEPGRRGFAYGTLPGHPRARRGSLHRQPAPGRDGDLFHHCLLQPRYAAGQGSRTDWQGHPAPHHQPPPAGNHPLITFSRSGHITIRFSAHRMARAVPRPVSRAAGGSICMWRDRWSQQCAEHVSDVLEPAYRSLGWPGRRAMAGSHGCRCRAACRPRFSGPPRVFRTAPGVAASDAVPA